MPIKRRLAKNRKETLTQFEWKFFLCEPMSEEEQKENAFEQWFLSYPGVFGHGETAVGKSPLKVWEVARETVVPEWIRRHPGTRPPYWWFYDAPRMQKGIWPGCYWDGQLEQPRERLGGKGGPPWECGLAHVPNFRCGLPKQWAGEFDPDDPPLYESEASYLKRHGLLQKSELRQLPEDAFEPVELEFDFVYECMEDFSRRH